LKSDRYARLQMLHKPAIGAEHRRALTLLVKSANGLSEPLMQARSVPASVLRDLLRAKLVTIEAQRRRGYGNMVVIKRLRITEDGLRAIK
jgi:hypothetical protein